jgi:hypothetical protein
MLKKLAVPFLTLTMAAFGCSSSTTPTPGTGGTGGTATGGTGGGAAGANGGAGGATGAAGGSSGAAGHGLGGLGGGLGGLGGHVSLDGGTLQTYTVTLNGAQEGLPTVTGTGSATVTLDTTSGACTVTGTFTGLTGAASAAHIHGPALPGQTAAVLHALTVTAATSGTLSGNVTLTPGEVTDMLTGMTYLNIHTAANSAGEIRGNINPAP